MDNSQNTPLIPEDSQTDLQQPVPAKTESSESSKTGTLYNETGGNEIVPPPDAEDRGLGAYEPLSPAVETAPEAKVAVPPPESTHGAPPPGDATLPGPGPAAGIHLSQDLPASNELLTLLVTDQQMQALWERIHKAQENIHHKISNLAIARSLFDDLQCARNELLAGRDHFEEADRALGEVEYRIHLSGRVAQWSYSVGSWLVVYEVAWFILAILGLLFASPWLFRFVQAYSAGPASPTWPAEPWAQDLVFVFNSMMWGVLGGITGAIYALIIHIARLQDFDKQYSMWYLLTPLGGFVAGAFVFLVIRLGVFSLTAGAQTAITSPLIIYALAWLSGFQQNVIYDMVKNLLATLKVGPNTEQKS